MKLAKIWNTPLEINAFPEMSFEEVMCEGGIKTWLTHIQRIGFVIINGAPATSDATEALMERMAYVRNSIFGGFSVWDNKLENPDDTAFTSSIN